MGSGKRNDSNICDAKRGMIRSHELLTSWRSAILFVFVHH